MMKVSKIALASVLSLFSLALHAIDVADGQTVTANDFTYLTDVSFKGTQTAPVTAVVLANKANIDVAYYDPDSPVSDIPDFVISGGYAGKISASGVSKVTLRQELKLTGGGQLDIEGNFEFKAASAMVGGMQESLVVKGGSTLNILANSHLTTTYSVYVGWSNDTGKVRIDASSSLAAEDILFGKTAGSSVEVVGTVTDPSRAIFSAEYIESRADLVIDITNLDFSSIGEGAMISLFECTASSGYESIMQSFLDKLTLVYGPETYDLILSADGKSIGFKSMIPEASTYAAVFGFPALALAAFRRRR